MPKRYFVSGIGTDVGKTVVSAVLVEALQADYWKPVQAGDLHHSDTDKVRALVSNTASHFHPNTYALKTPASPHYAAELDEVSIVMSAFSLPKTNNSLIIEGAGGLMVPLNEKDLVIDLIEQLESEIILVVNNYLGSINHTLLSIEVIKQRGLPLKGVIICGESYAPGEDFILNTTKVELLGRIAHIEDLSREEIYKNAQQFKFLKND